MWVEIGMKLIGRWGLKMVDTSQADVQIKFDYSKVVSSEALIMTWAHQYTIKWGKQKLQ